uniref:Saposin B-type domain-containing protein n=1 Tax=Clastoptera arizonana TaxID=38151 RepID=A0A1B6D4V0_9HEMI
MKLLLGFVLLALVLHCRGNSLSQEDQLNQGELSERGAGAFCQPCTSFIDLVQKQTKNIEAFIEENCKKFLPAKMCTGLVYIDNRVSHMVLERTKNGFEICKALQLCF